MRWPQYPSLAYGCPHCMGAKVQCCVCGGSGRIWMEQQINAAMAWAWARPDCGCEACEQRGDPPGTVNRRLPRLARRQMARLAR